MATYGLQNQVAKNTTGYPTTSVPTYAPKVSTSTPLSPYASQTAKQTTGSDSLYPSVKPVTPVSPTKTVSPTPAAQPSSTPVAQSANPLYDYTTDPILQQVQAQSTQANADAQAAALASQKQLAIQYGDVDLANSLGDTATAQAAGANPFSIYGMLNTQQPKDELALDESENKNNLYYSGDRVTQQGNLANQYGATRAQDAAQEQAAQQQIQATQLAAQLAAQQAVTQAQSDAYNRYLQQLLANPPSVDDSTASGVSSTPTPVDGTNIYGGYLPPVAAYTTPPATATSPYTVSLSANKTGGSANKKQGVYAIH